MSTYPCCPCCAGDPVHDLEPNTHTIPCDTCAYMAQREPLRAEFAAPLAAVTAERDALAAAVARVRALHNVRGRESWFMPRCSECYGFYPCPTIRTLDGTP